MIIGGSILASLGGTLLLAGAAPAGAVVITAGLASAAYGLYQIRPRITGEVVWWQSLPAPHPVGVIGIVRVSNRGRPTGLVDWAGAATVNGERYQLRVRPQEVADVPHPCGRPLRFSLGSNLVSRTLAGAVGEVPVYGYVYATTHELAREELVSGNARIALIAHDRFEREWVLPDAANAAGRHEMPAYPSVTIDS